MTALQQTFGRWTLSLLWLITALVSVATAQDIGLVILQQGGVADALAPWLLYGGSVVDALLGLWLLLPWAQRLCFQIQLITIAVYSVLLSVIAPEFWWHPFAPVVKNLPIMVLIWILMPGKSIS